MSTQKDIIHYSLFQYLAQKSGYISRTQGIPALSTNHGARRARQPTPPALQCFWRTRAARERGLSLHDGIQLYDQHIE